MRDDGSWCLVGRSAGLGAVLGLLLSACGASGGGAGVGADASAEGGCVDEDGDGFGVGPACEAEPDCDDRDVAVYPGASELCGNEVDDDCDGETDEGFELLGTSCDVGLGACRAQGVWVCDTGSPALRCDADPAADPAAERCNGLDDDCDGDVDEDLDCGCTEGEEQPCWPGSPDTRGKGICADGVQRCLPTGQWGDCEEATLPEAEVCDGVDNDCNGFQDDVDVDGDSYWACPGVSQRDCDDANRDIHPGALEECNGVDDNCNGLVDEEVLTVYYLDIDGDGYGSGAANVSACEKPMGYAELPGDCNDSNPDIHPGASEVCNEADDDCNGLVDDGLPLLDIYPDGDGDGFAPPGTMPRQKCNVPIGWATAQDPDGDGTPNWDCDDSSATVHPAAEARCDGVDNDCDGLVDRWCARGCGGSWPVGVGGSGNPTVAVADMDQDNTMEVGIGGDVGGVLVEDDGTPLWSVTGAANVLRRPGVFADVDFAGRSSRKRLEWVIGANSRMGFVRLNDDGTATDRIEPAGDVYDAGSYLARDLNGDGRAEIVAMQWNGRIRVFEWNSSRDLLDQVVTLDPPDNGHIYTNGFAFGDPDGDGRIDLVFGTGYARATTPSTWRGAIYAFRYDHGSRSFTNTCVGCFGTAISGIFPASVSDLLVHDVDGDGVQEVLANVTYFSTNTDGVTNTGAGVRQWVFDGTSGAVESGPAPDGYTVPFDLDGDGTDEAALVGRWYLDVDGDGDYDRLAILGGYPVIVFRDGASESEGPRNVRSGGSIRWIGDLDNDGRLDVLVSRAGEVQCLEFGEQTWDPWRLWEPVGPVPRETRFYRSGLLDQAEPNEDAANAYALAVNGWMRGYVQHASDVDWYKVYAYCPQVTVQAPRSLDLRVRTYADLDMDGTLERFANRLVGAGTRAHFTCDDHTSSPRNIWMYVEVRGESGAASPSDPYRMRFRASF